MFTSRLPFGKSYWSPHLIPKAPILSLESPADELELDESRALLLWILV